MDQEKPYFGGETPKRPNRTPESGIDAVALRKALGESLTPILTDIPTEIATAVAKGMEKYPTPTVYTMDPEKMAESISRSIGKIQQPNVTVDVPDVVRLHPETVKALGNNEDLERSVEKLATAVSMIKKDEGTGIRALAEEMMKNPEVWFNFRLVDGKSFIDKMSETIMVGMGGANVAKDATLRAIQSLLAQPLSVSGIHSYTNADGRVGVDVSTSSIAEKTIIDEISLATPVAGHFPLAGGEVFDSGWIDTKGFAAIVLTAIDNTSGGAPFRLEEHWSTDASSDIFQDAAGIYLSGSSAGYGLQVLAGAKRTILMRYVRYIWRMDSTDQATGSPDTFNFTLFNVKLLPTPIPYDANIVNTRVPVGGDGAIDGPPVLMGGLDSTSSPTSVNAAVVNSVGSLQVIGASTTLNAGAFVVVANRGNSTASLSNVTEATSSTQLAAAATGRRGFAVFNDTANVLILKYGTAASGTSFTIKVAVGGYWEMPDPLYTGAVHGISAGTGGTWRVTTW